MRFADQVERKLTKMDCIIEVHDARVPFSGRNQKFLERLRAARPHVLLYNKVDLIPRSTVPYLKRTVVKSGKHHLPEHTAFFSTDFKSVGTEFFLIRALSRG